MDLNYRKGILIAHIDWALSQDITPEWRDGLNIGRERVLNNYPLFNSKSTLPVTCPVCGTTREVLLLQLYNLKGMHECRACNMKRVRRPDIGRAARTPESISESLKKAVEAHTSESYKKIWQTRKSNSL